MDIYITDDEKEEALKLWLKKWAPRIILTVCFVWGLFFVHDIYTQHKEKNSLAAAAIYYEILAISSNAEQELFLNKFAELKNKYPGSIYTSLAALVLVEHAKDFSVQQELLDLVIEKGSVNELKSLAEYRLAKILWNNDKNSLALQHLDKIKNSYLAVLALELMGDIHYEKEDFSAAASLYTKALDNNQYYDSAKHYDRAIIKAKLSQSNARLSGDNNV